MAWYAPLTRLWEEKLQTQQKRALAAESTFNATSYERTILTEDSHKAKIRDRFQKLLGSVQRLASI
jgi:hypothetical protein